MAALVEFRDVGCAIGGRDILRDIRLAVDAGETLALLGRSGSGKTTLLRTVNCMAAPTSGEVWFEGRPVREWDAIQLRRRIGYVIQEGGLLPHRTVERNIGLAPSLLAWPAERIRARVAELLEAMGLEYGRYAGRFPRELSGGEKQRVGIARALAAKPPLLLMDEPFAALDPVTRFELQRQFLELRRLWRQTAIFVTHDVREALMLGTRIALMKDGRLESVQPPEEFLRDRTPEARSFLATLEWKPDA